MSTKRKKVTEWIKTRPEYVLSPRDNLGLKDTHRIQLKG